MKPTTPQWKLLYWAMQKGRRLTALDVFKLSGSLNAHKRMQDVVKQTGLMVFRGWNTVGKKRVRVFFMKGYK